MLDEITWEIKNTREHYPSVNYFGGVSPSQALAETALALALRLHT